MKEEEAKQELFKRLSRNQDLKLQNLLKRLKKRQNRKLIKSKRNTQSCSTEVCK